MGQGTEAEIDAGIGGPDAKYVLTRSRPSHGDNPPQGFHGSGHDRSPIGEAVVAAALPTPM